MCTQHKNNWCNVLHEPWKQRYETFKTELKPGAKTSWLIPIVNFRITIKRQMSKIDQWLMKVGNDLLFHCHIHSLHLNYIYKVHDFLHLCSVHHPHPTPHIFYKKPYRTTWKALLNAILSNLHWDLTQYSCTPYYVKLLQQQNWQCAHHCGTTPILRNIP